MKTMKKLLSSFLAIAMIITMIQPSIFATDKNEESEQRGKVSMVYLGEGSEQAFYDDSPSIQAQLPDTSEWEVGTVFWVGLTISDAKKMDEGTKGSHPSNKEDNAPAQNQSHFSQWANQEDYTSNRSGHSGGISNIAAGFEYASKYIEPAAEMTTDIEDNYSTIMSNFEDVYTNYGTITASMNEDITKATGREASIITEDNQPKVVYISMSTSQSNPSNKLFGFTDDLKDDPICILAVPFKIKELPPAGTKVIQAALNQSQFVIQTGTNSLPIWKSQWNSDRNVTPEHNIKNHFDYTGDLNLFPAKVDVTYNAGEGSFKDELAEDNRKESVIEGGNPTLKYNGKDISDYLNPPVGKVFVGWYEDENNETNDKPFTTESTVDEEKTVYAHYTDGYKVTFNLNGENAQFTDGTSDAKSFTAKMGESVIKTSLQDLIGENPTRAEYTFAGWYTKTEGTFIEQYDENAIKGNTNNSLDLYAKWTPTNDESKQYTLNFDSNLPDAAPADPASVKYDEGDTLQALIGGLPVPPKPQGDYEGYDFLGWYKNKSGDGDMLTEEQTLSDYIDTGDSNEATVYACWGYVLGPYDEPKADAITVKFHKDEGSSKYSDANGGSYAYGTINDKYVDYGDTIPNMPNPADMTHDTKGFDGWYTKPQGQEDGKKVDSTTVINSDLDPSLQDGTKGEIILYAHWSDKVTVTFNPNGGTPNSIDQVTLYANQTIGDVSESKDMPTVTRDNYTFEGWYYKEGEEFKKVEKDTPITKSLSLTAMWKGTIDISFDETEFEYNGKEQTPLTEGNVKVTLKEDSSKTNLVPDPIPLSYLEATYTKQGQEDTVESPTNAMKYDMDLSISDEGQAALKEKFLIYEPTTFENEFEIKAKTINYVVSNNYQYLANDNVPSGITNVTIEIADGTDEPKPSIDVFGDGSDDIKVKFENLSDHSSTADNTMPQAFGNYDIVITAVENSNFAVGTVSDKAAGDGGDADLHIVPTSRVVHANYGDGTVKDDTAHEKDYVTVNITTPTPPQKLADAKTNLTLNSKTLPQEGTDFTPPTGKTIDKFVTYDNEQEKTGEHEFTATTDIPAGTGEPLNIYAVYKDAQWTVTFKDTKTADKADDVTYTVEAKKPISTEGAVKKVNGEDADPAPTTLPTIDKAPESKMFGGWSTDKNFAEQSISNDYKASDLTTTYKANMFTVDTVPEEGTSTLEVYAVYVLSDDASLKKPGDDGTGSGAVFKKDSSDGDDLPFANERWEKQPDQKFDPDTEKHYLIVDDDETENVYGELTPSQPGSTVTVEVNGQPADVSGPDGDGKYTFTFKPEQTTYDDESDTNSSTKVEVTVTAPDGTTSEKYEFDILQYATARVELNYGNSPVGMIMSDDETYDGEEAKQAAVTAFKSTHKFSGVTANLDYYTNAWTTYEDYNGDEDPYAMFVFQRKAFKDVGFTAYDSMDKPVADSSVSSSLSMKVFKGGLAKYTDDELTTDNPSETATGNNHVFVNFVDYDIRPDVYEMKYTFTDPITEDTVEQTRKVIAISRRGDVYIDANDTINNNDASEIMANIGYFASVGVHSLYKFRIADTVTDENYTANNNDASEIMSKVTTGIDQFYKALPQN